MKTSTLTKKSDGTEGNRRKNAGRMEKTNFSNIIDKTRLTDVIEPVARLKWSRVCHLNRKNIYQLTT